MGAVLMALLDHGGDRSAMTKGCRECAGGDDS
jgi:hypothetical protein